MTMPLEGHVTRIWHCPRQLLPRVASYLAMPSSMGITYHLKTLDPEPGGCTKEYLFVIGVHHWSPSNGVGIHHYWSQSKGHAQRC